MGQKKIVQNGYNPTLWQAEWNKQMMINQRIWEYSPDVSFHVAADAMRLFGSKLRLKYIR